MEALALLLSSILLFLGSQTRLPRRSSGVSGSEGQQEQTSEVQSHGRASAELQEAAGLLAPHAVVFIPSSQTPSACFPASASITPPPPVLQVDAAARL